MASFLLLFLCLALGALAARFATLPAGTAKSVNWWVLRVALPALVLTVVPSMRFESTTWFLVATMALVFLGAWALFLALGRALGWSRERVGALTLVAGLGNTSFMGYPMIEAMHGKAGLTLAVVSDQLGCFPLLAAGGITVASLHAGRKPSAALVARRVFTFPAFIALVIGLVAHALGGLPTLVGDVARPIGQTLTPLALFSVGLQLKLRLQRDQRGALAAALGWKLLVAPLLCAALGFGLGVRGLTLTVGVLQAAMAPMISAALLADEYGLEPSLANAVLGAGILVSLVTVPLANLSLP